MSGTQQNHSKYYYVSNENMSDIKESIEQYSMNFDSQSGVHGNSRSEIAEMISGSHQATQSRAAGRTKTSVPQQPVIIEEQVEENLHRGPNEAVGGQETKKAVYLGDHVYNTIRERYFETNKITTDDPQVLYDFFIAQRKSLNTMKPIKKEDIEKQMPSMQRKLMVKQQFQRILTYYPDDVYYSLCFEVEKLKKDRQLTQKVEYLNRGAKKDQKKKATKKDIDNIVQKLYKTKGNFEIEASTTERVSDEQVERIRRRKFGRNLSQHFQNSYRQRGAPMNVETAQKLHSFWQDLYERQEFGIQWDQANAKETIHKYMYEQIEDLMNYSNRKLGFKCGKAVSLYKFYTKHFEQIENIYIPLNSFEEYVKQYNNIERKKMEDEEKKAKQNQNKEVERRKKSQVKKFGRPVSATPLTVLSKPKTQNTNLDQLYEKYPHDKVIKALVAQENIKKPRYPMQYGLYNIEDEVKTKQWIRIDPKKPDQKYDKKIHEELYRTFTSQKFHQVEKRDRLMDIFAEEDLSKPENWKQFSPLMHQAMLVKAYEHKWFVDCIQRYVQRTTGANLKLQTNNVLMKRLFKHLDGLDQHERADELHKIETLILTSESIAEKTEKIMEFANQKMSSQQQRKQRSLLFVKLEDKAVDYVKMRINKTNEKFNLRKYLNKLFEDSLKDHKQYVKKHYHVVQGDKECPKLFKYQFFRLVKEVNPMILQREQSKKSHVWVPTKGTPETINYKSFNAFTEHYKKQRNIIAAEPERDQFRHSLWGRKKGEDRTQLLMTYNDSKECTFQPKISKRNL